MYYISFNIDVNMVIKNGIIVNFKNIAFDGKYTGIITEGFNALLFEVQNFIRFFI